LIGSNPSGRCADRLASGASQASLGALNVGARGRRPTGTVPDGGGRGRSARLIRVRSPLPYFGETDPTDRHDVGGLVGHLSCSNRDHPLCRHRLERANLLLKRLDARGRLTIGCCEASGPRRDLGQELTSERRTRVMCHPVAGSNQRRRRAAPRSLGRHRAICRRMSSYAMSVRRTRQPVPSTESTSSACIRWALGFPNGGRGA